MIASPSAPETMNTSITHQKNEAGIYAPILPDLKDWPIYKLAQKRSEFIDALQLQSMERIRNILGNNDQRLHDELARALYLERIRIKQEPWRVDPSDEWSFWQKVNKGLVESSLRKDTVLEEKIFEKIMNRYAEEIPGTFSPKSYNLASKVLPIAFNQLLNRTSIKGWFTKEDSEIKISDRIISTGNIELIRELATKGTILLVPTHFSNLDSVLIGWALHSLGLPSFLYGAGLNLFNSRSFGFFMNRLGAYKVDRRKKNIFYIETLKTYSQMTLQYGCHSLFFPGGTRARSGQLEKRLKLGLLGTAVEAQRLNFVNAHKMNPLYSDKSLGKKIFVVPLVLGYHFVLEAGSLIEQHLKRTGKERYYIGKQPFPSSYKIAKFLWNFSSVNSKATLSFAEPMDIFGNRVNASGQSLTPDGNPIDISAYFKSNGEFTIDTQRDSEYTKMLADTIIEKFHTANTVLSSHLVSFVAFQLLLRKHQRLDLYGVLRLPQEDREIPFEKFVRVVELIREKLKKMSDANEIQISNRVQTDDISDLIKYGILNLGVYHNEDPLVINKDGSIHSENMNLLYYYHNRLLGYELEKSF